MKAAGYTRVSTDEQEEFGVSLDHQDVEVRSRIQERDWQLHKIYSDVLSGSRSDRPGIMEMLAARQDFDVLVIWEQDRLGRDFTETVAVVGKLLDADVALEVISGPVDLDTPEGKAQFGMRAVFAEYERELIKRRTRMAAEAIARAGRYNGPPPHGFTFDDGALTPVPLEVAVVDRVYSAFLAGHGFSRIARELNADAVPTRRGGNWTQATIKSILTNPVYVGRIRFRGEEREGTHEGIVDPDIFARAQVLVEVQGTPRGKGRGRLPNGSHLFVRGLLRCGECGEAMVARTRGIDNYLCNGRQTRGCAMPMVHRADIDKAVYAYFEQVGLDVEATRRTIAESRDRKLHEIRELLSEADREHRRAAERLERVRRDYQDGKLDAEDWSDQRGQLVLELEACSAAAERLHDQEADVSAWSELGDLEQETLERLTEIRRAVAGEVTDRETIEPVRAALAQIFDRFVLHRPESPHAPRRLEAELGAVGETGLVIEPIVREQAIDGYSDSMRPVLHREPLAQLASAGATNDAEGRPTVNCFAPICVPVGGRT